jgi:molecular chaperone DnaK (HSP70)
MGWITYRDKFKASKPTEAHFVLGLDLGEDSSIITYYDVNRAAPEIIDVSGGYGKPSVPTAMQYISETDEWIFGEYAVLNTGSGETFRGLLEKANRGETLEAGGKAVNAVSVLGMYIRELISNCKNINPKAEIAGIALTVPSYLSEEAKTHTLSAVREAGYEKELIGLYSDRECIFQHFYAEKPSEMERVLLLDFAGREFRGGIYEVTPEKADKISIVSISSLFDRELGTMRINNAVNDLFTRYYREHTNAALISETVREQLLTFTYQHKDLLFVRNERDAAKAAKQNVKLYFNFAYPPFQKAVSQAEMEYFTEPYKRRMGDFFQNVFKRTLMPESMISKHDINTVLCTGGGFEMFWAKQMVREYFNTSNVVFYKNPKGAAAEGACLTAAGALNITNRLSIQMSDFHKLKSDIGVFTQHNKRKKFVPLAVINSFWWQQREPGAFIVTEPITDGACKIDIVKRTANGDIEPLGNITLDNLPERPEGTTKLGITATFPTYDKLSIEINDLGFGELFPKTDYNRAYDYTYK